MEIKDTYSGRRFCITELLYNEECYKIAVHYEKDIMAAKLVPI
jgi:hypothetical protein